MDDTKRVIAGLALVVVLGLAVLTHLRAEDSTAAVQQSISDTQRAVLPPALTASGAESSNENTHRQIYLLRSQTLYLADKKFSIGVNPTATDAYQNQLLARIDDRYGLTEAQGKAIDEEGAQNMWPIMGSDGSVSQLH